MKKNIQSGKRFGTIAIPASKSDGQRALLAAALSKGESKLINLINTNYNLLIYKE